MNKYFMSVYVITCLNIIIYMQIKFSLRTNNFTSNFIFNTVAWEIEFVEKLDLRKG